MTFSPSTVSLSCVGVQSSACLLSSGICCEPCISSASQTAEAKRSFAELDAMMLVNWCFLQRVCLELLPICLLLAFLLAGCLMPLDNRMGSFIAIRQAQAGVFM